MLMKLTRWVTAVTLGACLLHTRTPITRSWRATLLAVVFENFSWPSTSLLLPLWRPLWSRLLFWRLLELCYRTQESCSDRNLQVIKNYDSHVTTARNLSEKKKLQQNLRKIRITKFFSLEDKNCPKCSTYINLTSHGSSNNDVTTLTISSFGKSFLIFV